MVKEIKESKIGPKVPVDIVVMATKSLVVTEIARGRRTRELVFTSSTEVNRSRVMESLAILSHGLMKQKVSGGMMYISSSWLIYCLVKERLVTNYPEREHTLTTIPSTGYTKTSVCFPFRFKYQRKKRCLVYNGVDVCL